MGRYQLPRGFPRPTSNVRTQVADATRPLYPSDNSPGWVRFAEQGWVRSAERYRTRKPTTKKKLQRLVERLNRLSQDFQALTS